MWKIIDGREGREESAAKEGGDKEWKKEMKKERENGNDDVKGDKEDSAENSGYEKHKVNKESEGGRKLGEEKTNRGKKWKQQ